MDITAHLTIKSAHFENFGPSFDKQAEDYSSCNYNFFLSTILLGQRQKLASDNKNMEHNQTAIFKNLKLVTLGIKNMDSPKHT